MSSQPVPGPVGRPRGRRLPAIFRYEGWQGLIFIAPAVVLLGGLVAYPLVWTIVYSFGDTNSKLDIVRWVGLDNYERLFTKDKVFLDRDVFPPDGALVNNLKWGVLYTTFSLAFGLLIAILAARVRYESLVKAVIFVPMAIAATAIAIIWKLVYEPDPDLGVANAVATVWLTINVIKLFDVIYVIARGGPGTSSEVIATQMYDETFLNGEGGYGAAIAVVMLLLILPLMAYNVSRFRTERV